MMKITLSGTFLRAPQSKMWVPPLDSVMKKLRIFLSIQLILGFLISVPSLAATQLDVTGKGMVSVAPDEATITAHGVFPRQEARDEALVKAVKDARKKLTLLAGAADMSLTSISQISEVAPHSARPQPTLMRAEMALDSAASNTFVAENLTFVAEVRAQAEAE